MAAPGNGAVIAIAAGEPLSRVPPARSTDNPLREGSTPHGRDAKAARFHESPVRQQPHVRMRSIGWSTAEISLVHRFVPQIVIRSMGECS